MESDYFFRELADETDALESTSEQAPPQLKSIIYSALVTQLAATGPLLSLSATKREGRALCVFEAALTTVSIGERIESKNPCRVCHARILGEKMESAPIFWPHCPYTQFHQG